MPETPTPMPIPKPRRKRRWWVRLLRGFLWFFLTLVLILLLFHRPLVHYGGRWAAIWIAKKQHLDLDLKIRGNIWSHLEITEIKARADGTGPAPLEKLDLDRIAVDYSVLKLIRGDLSGLEALEIGTVDAVIPENKEPPKPKTAPSAPLAETLRGLLKKPLPAPRVQIGRVDVRVKNSGGDIVVQNFRLSLVPGGQGVFGWDKLELPGRPPIDTFMATTEFAPGDLRVERKGEGSAETLFSFVATPAGATPSAHAAAASVAPTVPAAPAGLVQVDLHFLGFRVTAFVAPPATGNSMRGEVTVQDVDVRAVAAAVGAKAPPPVRVPKVDVTFEGDPAHPETWQAALDVSALGDGPELPAGSEVKLHAAVKAMAFELSDLQINGAGASLAAHGRIPIPPALLKGDTAGALPAVAGGAIDFTVDVPDVATVGKLLQKPLAGKVHGAGRLALDAANAVFSFDLDGDSLASPPASVTKTSVKVRATQSLQTLTSLRSVVATVETHLQGAGTKEFLADEVSLSAGVQNLHAALSELKIARGNSIVQVSGEAVLDEKGKLATTPTGKFSLNIPALADYQLAVKDQPVTGAITGDGQFTVGQPVDKSSGKVSLRGSGLRLGDADIGGFEIELNAADGLVKASRVAFQLAGKTTLNAEGQVALAEPHAYTGKVSLDAPDLEPWQKLLAALGKKLELAGKVTLSVESAGDLAHPAGSLRLEATDVVAGDAIVDEARLAAKFTPDSAEVSEFSVDVGKLHFGALLAWKDRRATLSNLDLRLDNASVLSGSFSAPFDPKAKKPLADDQPIIASLEAKNLDLAKFLPLFAPGVNVAGTVSLNLAASGTLAQPSLKLDFAGNKLRTTVPAATAEQKAKSSTVVQPTNKAATSAPAPMDLPPTDVEAHVTLAGSDVKLIGAVKQPLVQTLTFSGNTTLSLKPLLEGQPFDAKALPISASVDLPASKLDFVPRLVPAVAKIDGTAAIAVRVKGTVGQPQLEGSTTLDLKLVRLSNGAAPVITSFKGRVNFAGDRVTLGDFGGELGGGKFSVKGSVGLTKPAEPEFDLTLNSKDVLLLRDDSILVRADADVTLHGPMKAAEAKGTVFVVSSRFNKEVEILPLSLPGKPKPTPKVAAEPVRISFPDPPLRDWKFDIAIKTRADDPFLVRGNLARGKVTLDLHLAGTGLEPYMTGAATIEQFDATLPMSKLTTRRGLITFSQESPFQPYVEIEAETVIRQYTVVARVSGPATKPELDLESEPPLPQQEILSLLTTGSLTGEIGENNTALATRAAVLVLKSWYQKIFKRNVPLDEDQSTDSLLDRFQVDFGAVDPKTGRNETTAQVRLTDKFFLIGDLQMGGGYSGRVKYLIRFK